MTFQDPKLFNIKKIGHDLHTAISKELTDVLRNAENLYCTQHLQKADERHLKAMCANRNTTERIMADIYGAQHSSVQELGLADAVDEEDLDVKLMSLKNVWDELLPNVHSWFVKNRSEKFKANLVLSARSHLNIKGRFYTNGLVFLSEFVDEFYTEAARALRGVGRYRLAPGYENSYVDPSKWNQWSVKRREQHLNAFFAYIPKQSYCYQKLASAGLKKAPRVKRRVEKKEPAFFLDRTLGQSLMPKDKVTPIELANIGHDQIQTKEQSSSTVLPRQKRNSSPAMLDPLNPDRKLSQQFQFQLIHHSDHKNCPPSVKRCQSCKRAFTSSDWVVVKTEGTREWTTAN